jgi:cytochrome c oxidase cbb3-type subunit 3
MPAFLKDQLLNAAQINDVAEFVLSLAGRGSDPSAAGRGKALFAEQCVSCHGETGQGNQEFGAPSLRDAIWLYGGDKRTIVGNVSNAVRGVMPAWEGRLDPVTIKVLTVYVHSLGGGKK